MALGTFFVSTSYPQDKLSYTIKVLKSLSCLLPDQGNSSSSKIAVVASELPCCNEGEISSVLDEWKVYQELDIPEDWKVTKEGTNAQVDIYWAKVLGVKDPFGQPRFKTLSKVVKCALTLSHGIADTERSLSQNKKVVTKEKSSMLHYITHYREDTNCNSPNKRCCGHPTNIVLTQPLLDCCGSAHKVYKAALEETKEKERKKGKGSR